MVCNLDLWLEPEPGCEVPPDCYAAVRNPVSEVCSPVLQRTTAKANYLGPGKEGDAIMVDVFQCIGSISLDCLKPGLLQEAAIKWPGRPSLQMRVKVVAVDLVRKGTEVFPATVQLSPDERTLQEEDDEAHLISQVPEPIDKIEDPNKDLVSPPQKTQKTDKVKSLHHHSPLPEWRVAEPVQVPRKMPVSNNVVNLPHCDRIVPNLYLGGIDAASDKPSLYRAGIRAVCCCCRELEFPTKEFSEDLAYYRVDVEDVSREPIELFFPEATEFIHSWISREQPVLVHCRAGVSRSATVVIAYLIAYHGYSLHDAFFLARSHRSVVTPNLGFLEKLGEYEESIRKTEMTIDINKYIAWYQRPESAAVPDLKPE